MPKLRIGYGTEITQLGTLIKRIDKSLPSAWQQAVKEKTQDLIKLLIAADHDPNAHHSVEDPAQVTKRMTNAAYGKLARGK